MAITVKKLLTEHSKNGLNKDGEPARTLEYHEAHVAGIRGGTVHTVVEVDEPINVCFSPREAEAVVKALLTSKTFTRPLMNAGNVSVTAVENNVRITDALRAIGLTTEQMEYLA